MEKGDYSKAEILAKKSAEVREKLFGPDHSDTLTSIITWHVPSTA